MLPLREAAGFLLMTRSTPTKILLMRHKHRWDLPKGHAEPGEELLSTALRETEEETGIPRGAIEPVAGFQYVTEYQVMGAKRGSYQKRVTYYLGYVDAECPIALTEHLGYEWWPWPVLESIQTQTIDPLLNAVHAFFGTGPIETRELQP